MANEIHLEESPDMIDPVMEQAFSVEEPVEDIPAEPSRDEIQEDVEEELLEEETIDDEMEEDLLEDEMEEEMEEATTDSDIRGEDSQNSVPVVDLQEGYTQEQELPRHITPSISEIEFPELSDQSTGSKVDLDSFSNIPINLSVELGRSQITLKEVYELTQGSIIELERLVGEPLDLVVNEQIIAQGEVVAIDNNYGLRITSIVSKPQ